MKRVCLAILCLMAMAFLTRGAFAAEKMDVSGVVRTDYYGDSGKASISQVRFNVYAPTATGTYYFVRVEPNRYNLDSENWLKLAFVSIGKFTFGRVPLLEGYCLSSPDKLYTVSWPRCPAGFYGNAVQFKLSNAGTLEVSASPDVPVFQNEWGRAQVSLRLAKGSNNVILRYDDNQNSQVIVSGERNLAGTGTLLRGAFYIRSDDGKKKSGGYIFAEKSIGKKLGLHVQTDFAQRADTINTIGLRFKEKKSFAILDYEVKPRADRFLASVIITF